MTFEAWQQRDTAQRQHEEHERWMAHAERARILEGCSVDVVVDGRPVRLEHEWGQRPSTAFLEACVRSAKDLVQALEDRERATEEPP